MVRGQAHARLMHTGLWYPRGRVNPLSEAAASAIGQMGPGSKSKDPRKGLIGPQACSINQVTNLLLSGPLWPKHHGGAGSKMEGQVGTWWL